MNKLYLSCFGTKNVEIVGNFWGKGILIIINN